MAKTKTVFVCQNCGAQSPKWVGKCNSCGQWNTFEEEIITTKSPSLGQVSNSLSYKQKPIVLSDVETESFSRINTHIEELNTVIGGGIVPGSVLLLGGEPGVGKSTLLLQVAGALKKKVLYVSGEESPQQILMRAQRLRIETENCIVYNETSVFDIVSHVQELKPDLLIVDSVQTLKHTDIDSSPGTVSQIRETSNVLIELAKQTHMPLLLIGHITKEGAIAGPKVLEHMVDVVLQFEGDMHNVYRVLRSIKNRFGSTSEIGIFEMVQTGLKEVVNPSEMLINRNKEKLSGVAIAATMEGMRPMFVEVQALVSTAAYGTPQRTVNGYDNKRVNMLLAVIEKRLGIKVYTKDVFINIAGGLKVQDTATDLAIIAAILSSLFDVFIPGTVCFAGEVGLTGEVRSVSQIEKRVKESSKLGMKQMYVPSFQNSYTKSNFTIIECSRVDSTFKTLFQNAEK
ncbi:MAG: DNA repair protein RadA [Bacteroidales bacterium]